MTKDELIKGITIAAVIVFVFIIAINWGGIINIILTEGLIPQ